MNEKDLFLEFMKKYRIPIPRDYQPDSFLDMNMEINNIEKWKIWYDKMEEKESELYSKSQPVKIRMRSLIEKGDFESTLQYFEDEIEMIYDFLNFYNRTSEFWEKSFNWLIEITNKKSELDPKHKFRIDVLKRDKWTCRKCGKHCNSAHHIYSRKYCQNNAPELEWDIRNGVALCFDCHKAITEDGKKWFNENR